MENRPPRLVILSGLSGGGKSSALDALEDLGFYCVDNLPGAILPSMIHEIETQPQRYHDVAIGMDVRMGSEDLATMTQALDEISSRLQVLLVFVEADNDALMRRFSETRRRHPLTQETGLGGAIAQERQLLDPIRERADHIIDTSQSNIHQLRHQIWRLIGGSEESNIQVIVVESFAFKHGVPRDVDFLFDARALPNPHWEKALRPLDGRDQEVIDWLETHHEVTEFKEDIVRFFKRWLPPIAQGQRSLLTIAIGCTGGQHRSVYLSEQIARALQKDEFMVKTFHRELN